MIGSTQLLTAENFIENLVPQTIKASKKKTQIVEEEEEEIKE